MTYSATPPKFEALQLGAGPTAQDDFLNTLNLPSVYPATKHSDGSITIGGAIGGLVNPGDWAVYGPYYGTFPGWGVDNNAPSGFLADADFAERYTSA